MGEKEKCFKVLAKEAKQRLKENFWQNYKAEMSTRIEKAREDGINVTEIKNYCAKNAIKSVRGIDKEEEEFYLKVKGLLEKDGEVSDMLGRLIEREEYDALPYEGRQRYIFRLSERYLKALERYKREKIYNKM